MLVEALGAQGGGEYGGFGAEIRATLAVSSGQQLTVLVGGQGSLGVGGYNGGGGSAFGAGSIGSGQGGGGASDIRVGGDDNAHRVIVAAGGGGGAGGPTFGMGGSAGGTSGEPGENGSGLYHGGGGATLTATGDLGGDYAGAGSEATGGSGGFTAGGGGGGYFGGGGGGGDSSGGSPGGGGAGSSYTGPGVTAATYIQGANVGNGTVIVSWGTPISNPGDAAKTFAYTGASQTYRVPDGTSSLDVQAIGGQGGAGTEQGGYGAKVSATIPVVGGQIVAVLVGGHGGPADACGALTCGDPGPGNSIGGFNGGGDNTFAGAGAGRGSGGGGATDIRIGSWKLSARAMVAGGGGGSASNPDGTQPGLGHGGNASGTVAASGADGNGQYHGGGGGTPTAGGASGGNYGGDGLAGQGGQGGFSAGSGGGGWFGGGGGGGDSSGGTPGGGGAGSSYAEAFASGATFDVSTSGGDGGATIAATGTSTPDPDPTTFHWAALGDSYSAGEGVRKYMNGSDTETNHCHRSTRAYSQLLAGPPGQTLDMAFHACAGANLLPALDSWTQPNSGNGEQAQDSWLNGSTDLVTMTYGGNVLDWNDAVKACTTIRVPALQKSFLRDDAKCDAALTHSEQRVTQLMTDLKSVYESALNSAPQAQVRVLDYPPIFPVRTGKNASRACEIGTIQADVSGYPATLVRFELAADTEKRVAHLQEDVQRGISQVVSEVRQESADNAHRLQLVSTWPAYGGDGIDGHTIGCGDSKRPDPWVNDMQFDPQTVTQVVKNIVKLNKAVTTNKYWTDLVEHDTFAGSFHPRARGQRALADALGATLYWHPKP